MANLFAHSEECATVGRIGTQTGGSDFLMALLTVFLASLRLSFPTCNVEPKTESITEDCKQEVYKNALESREPGERLIK